MSNPTGPRIHLVKLYRQMYAHTGIATDSARVQRSARLARWMAKACRRFFVADPIAEVVV